LKRNSLNYYKFTAAAVSIVPTVLIAFINRFTAAAVPIVPTVPTSPTDSTALKTLQSLRPLLWDNLVSKWVIRVRALGLS
jgi:hypothetical protein